MLKDIIKLYKFEEKDNKTTQIARARRFQKLTNLYEFFWGLAYLNMFLGFYLLFLGLESIIGLLGFFNCTLYVILNSYISRYLTLNKINQKILNIKLILDIITLICFLFYILYIIKIII